MSAAAAPSVKPQIGLVLPDQDIEMKKKEKKEIDENGNVIVEVQEVELRRFLFDNSLADFVLPIVSPYIFCAVNWYITSNGALCGDCLDTSREWRNPPYTFIHERLIAFADGVAHTTSMTHIYRLKKSFVDRYFVKNLEAYGEYLHGLPNPNEF